MKNTFTLLKSSNTKKWFPYLRLLFVSLFLHSITQAQTAPTIEWQKSLGGSNDEFAYSIQQTTDGGFIIAGSSLSNDGNVSGNHGGYDFWVVKLDAIQNLEWQKSLGGSNDDFASSIQQTSDGGFIVAGYSLSSDGDVSENHGGLYFGDYWIVKLDSIGNLVWQKSLGGSNDDGWYYVTIQETADKGFIVAGSSNSNDGDVSGNHTDNYGNSIDCWIVKLNSIGNLVWQKSLGGVGVDDASSIRQTKDGGFIIAGTSSSNDGDVSGHHGYDSNYDYWIVRLDTAGNIAWQKSLGGSSADYSYSVQQTTDGGFIVAGYSQSTDGDVLGGDVYGDYWIVKLDISGNLVWQKSFGSSSQDFAYAVQQTFDGGYIVAGDAQSNDGDVSGNHGMNDDWIVKLDASGNIQWQKSLGGSNGESAASIQQTTEGGFIVAGSSWSNDGDVSGNHGGTDYWIVKLSPSSCSTPTGTITPLGNLDICETGLVKLQASSGDNYSYQWNRNQKDIDGATNQTFKAKKTGNYRVRISTGSGCHAVSKKTVVYSSCKLGEEDELISALNLFPNPTTGTFTLDLKLDDEENSQATIQVLNMLGQVVYDETTSIANGTLQKEIQLSDAAADGMYLVKVTINDRVFSSQINYQK